MDVKPDVQRVVVGAFFQAPGRESKSRRSEPLRRDSGWVILVEEPDPGPSTLLGAARGGPARLLALGCEKDRAVPALEAEVAEVVLLSALSCGDLVEISTRQTMGSGA